MRENEPKSPDKCIHIFACPILRQRDENYSIQMRVEVLDNVLKHGVFFYYSSSIGSLKPASKSDSSVNNDVDLRNIYID